MGQQMHTVPPVLVIIKNQDASPSRSGGKG